MEKTYWKVLMRYGHVGRRNEVSVARYLVTPSHMTIMDVLKIAEEMPGTKNRAALSVEKVGFMEFLRGKRKEQESFYLKRLFERETADCS